MRCETGLSGYPIAVELDAVADGATPHRAVDVGTRTRRSRPRTAQAGTAPVTT
ncbi:hypothetical protein MXD62_10890 [Frankia sp. Mgl5]|uniref:hypothetical protein n=1 Tax=Frankia sp. Mgl5 TaxID=2933793 RepID=UPI00200FF68F|nr:hypothetical protein [Frankia sp. Mgl5]MCK9927669.1 hypothetical protein [Frankia sp. Mgl5]